MKSNGSVVLLIAAVAAFTGCGPGQGASGDGSAEGAEAGTLGGSVSTADAPTEGSSDADPTPTTAGPGVETTGADPGEPDEPDEPDEPKPEPDEPPAACVGIDHRTCYPAVLDACVGFGNWDVSEQCLAAVNACYPMGTATLADVDIVQFCTAELSGDCLFSDGPGCGEMFCACTVGAFPFDWENCWHLTLVACRPEVASDCDTVLAGCYPGTTESDYETCKQQVMQTVGHECDCPMCSIHEACEAALDACMGA